MVTDAIQKSICALKDQDEIVRERAAMALGEIGSMARIAVPALTEALQDKDEVVRETVIQALTKISGRDAVPFVIQKLEERDPTVKRAAIKALGDLGGEQARQALIHMLEQKNKKFNMEVIIALGDIGITAVPTLIEALQHRNCGIRWAAILALVKISSGANALVPYVEQFLDNHDWVVRKPAARPRNIIETTGLTLLEKLWEKDIWVLAASTTSTREVIPYLKALLGDPDDNVSKAAAFALFIIDYCSIVSIIIEMFCSKNIIRGEKAAFALLTTPRPDSVRFRVEELLNHKDKSIRIKAVRALSKICSDEVVPLLAKATTDRNKSVRKEAFSTLVNKGGKVAAPFLIEALRYSNDAVSTEICDIFFELGEEALPALLKALNDDDKSLREKVSFVVSNIEYNSYANMCFF